MLCHAGHLGKRQCWSGDRKERETEARAFTVLSAGKARQDRGNRLGLPSSNHSGRLWGA